MTKEQNLREKCFERRTAVIQTNCDNMI